MTCDRVVTLEDVYGEEKAKIYSKIYSYINIKDDMYVMNNIKNYYVDLETKELWLRAKVALQYKELRKSKGMTLKDVAEKMGVSFQQVAKFENMINSPTLMFLVKYANALEVEVEVLLSGITIKEFGDEK